MSDDLAIRVTMLLFGELRERFGTGSIELTLPSGSTSMDLAKRFELADSLNKGVRVAVDGFIGASPETELSDGSEVAFWGELKESSSKVYAKGSLGLRRQSKILTEAVRLKPLLKSNHFRTKRISEPQSSHSRETISISLGHILPHPLHFIIQSHFSDIPSPITGIQ